MIFGPILRDTAKVLGTFTLHLVVFLLLLAPANASPTSAPDGVQCPAQSLLPRLKASQPERYRTFLKEARSVRNGRHILWKVERKGLKPSWLFGTIHSRDPRIFTLPSKAFSAFDKVDTVLVELKEVVQPVTIGLEVLKHPELTMLQDDRLDHLLPPEETVELATSLKQHGVPLDLVARMRPWFLMLNLEMPTCETRLMKAGRDVLDQAIAKKALDKKIALVGLETPLEQFQAIARVPDALMLEAVRRSFAIPYSNDDQLETVIDLYKVHDIGKIIALSNVFGAGESVAQSYTQYVLTDRNKIMAERAKPYLDKGRAMIAVGSAHLAGDEGLVELLRKQGFTVTAAD
ncbi:TraB/GumN family protein [Neorhizobium sp. P12A]|nr:TraB/GumN family protein [Neorhizobium sp. P12A]